MAEQGELRGGGVTPQLTDIFKVLPTTTVHQSRLQLYQPTRRPHWQERVILTPWGSAKIRGKLGQGHADVMEALCRYAEAHRMIEATGQLQLLVDPYKIRSAMGGGTPYSRETLWRMLTELREASITLEVPAHKIKVLGGILAMVEESPARRYNPLNKQDRALWRVTLDAAFVALIQQDLSLHYDPEPIMRLNAGASQAIARHVLTHRDQPQGGWSIDGLLRTVGAVQPGDDDTVIRNRRREIRLDIEGFRALGLVLEGDRSAIKLRRLPQGQLSLDFREAPQASTAMH